ncbi:MAG: single-stranded DNA-binding protein [Spirochaetaceae bacterium]|nr:single-stranded DNA-binding protein [Spirochaetaceae bacterium]MBO4704793.1 single-stranded DNA-binding protein [Spirochaetaceae bacterium]
MTDLNHVVLIGRLTHDVELKYLPNGSPVANLSIAVNRNKKEGDQWVEQTSFFNVQLWGNSAENLKQYLVKGKMIAVDGELRQDRWEKDGQTQSKVYIYSRNIQLLGGKDGGSGNGAGGYSQGNYQSSNRGSYQPKPNAGNSQPDYDGGMSYGGDSGFTEDIPF